MFKDWLPDDEGTFDQIFLNDSKCWKIDRFIKKPDELKELLEVIKENLPLLKKLHCLAVCRGTSYPYIGWLDFAKCVETCGILDKNFNLTTLDNVFIASNAEINKIEGNTIK